MSETNKFFEFYWGPNTEYKDFPVKNPQHKVPIKNFIKKILRKVDKSIIDESKVKESMNEEDQKKLQFFLFPEKDYLLLKDKKDIDVEELFGMFRDCVDTLKGYNGFRIGGFKEIDYFGEPYILGGYLVDHVMETE